MKIIDCHVNVTPNGDWINKKFNASLERLTTEMDVAGIDKATLVSLPGTNSNEYISEIINKFPKKFKGFACIDFNKNIILQTDKIIKDKFSGIKIHPRIQGVNICDDKFDYVWNYFNKKGIILLIDGYYQLINNKLLISDLMPLAYEKHIRKFSNVRIILAHAGFHKVMDTLFLCRSYPNFYTNISFSLNLIKGLSIYNDYKFLLEMCDQKVLFGSDFPEITPLSALKQFNILTEHLSEEKRNNILSLNAEKLFWNEKER